MFFGREQLRQQGYSEQGCEEQLMKPGIFIEIKRLKKAVTSDSLQQSEDYLKTWHVEMAQLEKTKINDLKTTKPPQLWC